MTCRSAYLSADVLQLLAGSDQTVADVPGEVQGGRRGAARPVAPLPAADQVPLLVPATGAAARAVDAAAIDGVAAMTSTHLQGAKWAFVPFCSFFFCL